MMGCCVISSEILHHKAKIHAEAEVAGKGHIWFGDIDLGLGDPAGIGLFDLTDVVGCEVQYGRIEQVERWVSSGKCGHVIMLHKSGVQKLYQIVSKAVS